MPVTEQAGEESESDRGDRPAVQLVVPKVRKSGRKTILNSQY